jgi:hypothetical protein
MAFREFHRHRIFNFTICEDAMQEPVSESLDGMLDARAFDHINTDTDQAHFVSTIERLTRSRPLTRSDELPVDFARVPAASFCETPGIGV